MLLNDLVVGLKPARRQMSAGCCGNDNIQEGFSRNAGFLLIRGTASGLCGLWGRYTHVYNSDDPRIGIGNSFITLTRTNCFHPSTTVAAAIQTHDRELVL